MAERTKVFISYSRDSPEHAKRVLDLADALQYGGLEVILDQYVHPAPEEGWPRWMDKRIDEANFVLMVCTETYRRRVMEQEHGKGLGVRWEGNLIYNRIYYDKPSGSRFVPVLLEGGEPTHIPNPVQGHTYYPISHFDLSDEGFEGLYRHLTGQAPTPPSEIGAIQTLSPRPRWVPPDPRNRMLSLETRILSDVNTDKARYAPGDRVTIYVDLTNTTDSTITDGNVTLYCKYLGTLVNTLPAQTLTLVSGTSRTLTFTWTPPGMDFRGYSVEAWMRDPEGVILDNRNTAVDVSSDWTRFPRYGYLSGYPSQSNATSTNTVWHLKNYHISALQFYDWQYKHHRPLAGTVANPDASWTDLANRTIYRQTVLDMINAAHDYGMSAMNYNLIYGAWSDYTNDGVDYRWGLWLTSKGTDQYTLFMLADWASNIYLFNPADAGWQNYIFGRESDVFAAYRFDGWHVDSVGNPSDAVYTYTGDPVDVWETFRPFLNNAKARLNKAIVFNNVGGYGLFDTAANTTNDVVYVECWPKTGQDTYNDLKTLIDHCVEWSGGKGVVLAAYMNYERAKNPGEFNRSSVLLANAAIFASGATHLELGDGGYMLCSEYFPNHNLVPSPALKADLRNYYDFLVAYQNLLQGRFKNIGNLLWLSVPNSNDARPDTVWAFTKASGDDTQHMINLINLRGVNSPAWRDDNADYPAPVPQSDIIVKYYYGAGTVTSVRWASPDFQNGKMNDLPHTFGADGGGRYVQFMVPSLAYWDMIYITK